MRSKTVITKLLNANKKVPSGLYVLNIPFIKKNTIYLKSTFTLN